MSDGVGIEKLKCLLEDSSYLYEDAEDKFDYIMAEMRKDALLFWEFHRLSPIQFDELLSIIAPELIIGPRRRGLHLSIALRYFSSGDSDNYYSELLGVNKSERVKIVTEVCNAVNFVLTPAVLMQPTKSNFLQNSVDFEKFWNFPNCVGAIDGRRILCQNPRTDEDKNFDLVVLTICDAHFRFMELHVKLFTRENVERKFLSSRCCSVVDKIAAEYNSELKQALPLVFVGGTNGFAKSNVIRAFNESNLNKEKLIFNHRHSRAMNAVDTALGILFKRWEIFQSRVIGDAVQVSKILHCVILLHNWLMNQEIKLPRSKRLYMPMDVLHNKDENGFLLEGNWGKYSRTQGVQPFQSDVIRTGMTLAGMTIRQNYVNYFVNEGAILSQWDFLKRNIIDTLAEYLNCGKTAVRLKECLSPAVNSCSSQEWRSLVTGIDELTADATTREISQTGSITTLRSLIWTDIGTGSASTRQDQNKKTKSGDAASAPIGNPPQKDRLVHGYRTCRQSSEQDLHLSGKVNRWKHEERYGRVRV